MGEACLLKARPSRRYCTYWRSGKCHNLSQGSKCNEFSSRALHHFTSIVEWSFLLYHRRVALILVACMHWASLPFFSCYRVSRENSKSLFFFPTLYIRTRIAVHSTGVLGLNLGMGFALLYRPGLGAVAGVDGCFALAFACASIAELSCERACDSGVGESWGKV